MEPFRTTLVRLINQARINPHFSAERLQKELQEHYVGEELRYFNKNIETFEGIEALNDLRKSLQQRGSSKSLIISETLNKVAQSIAEEKGKIGNSEHQSPKMIYQRICKYGQVEGRIGELISLKAHSSEQIAAYFLVDDGLATRKRRRMLLDQKYEFIGVGTAYHSVHEIITVIILADNIIEPLNMHPYFQGESRRGDVKEIYT